MSNYQSGWPNADFQNLQHSVFHLRAALDQTDRRKPRSKPKPIPSVSQIRGELFSLLLQDVEDLLTSPLNRNPSESRDYLPQELLPALRPLCAKIQDILDYPNEGDHDTHARELMTLGQRAVRAFDPTHPCLEENGGQTFAETLQTTIRRYRVSQDDPIENSSKKESLSVDKDTDGEDVLAQAAPPSSTPESTSQVLDGSAHQSNSHGAQINE